MSLCLSLSVSFLHYCPSTISSSRSPLPACPHVTHTGPIFLYGPHLMPMEMLVWKPVSEHDRHSRHKEPDIVQHLHSKPNPHKSQTKTKKLRQLVHNLILPHLLSSSVWFPMICKRRLTADCRENVHN